MAKIAVLGHGVVGSGVCEVILKNRQSILRRAGDDLEIKYILDIRDFPDLSYVDKFVKDFDTILNDDEIKVVVEVIGGIEPAFDFIKRSILKGKSVVTSNKELVAQKGSEILELARQNNVNFLFEASVGGGIPIIRPIHQCLAANELQEITGILNGTTNFILTKMVNEDMPFDTALKTSQKLGYAERNPSADIDGIDACRKICILASLAFGRHVYPDSVHTEGIADITLDDIECAKAFGGVIRLLGTAKRLDDGKIYILVAPFVLKRDHPLANVEDVFNGILVYGDAIGDVMFYGRGAGKLPTASAVVADVIDCIKHTTKRRNLIWVDSAQDFIADYKQQLTQKMVRLSCKNKNTIKEKLNNIFANYEEISCSASDRYALITPLMTESELDEKLKLVSNISENISILSAIRVVIH